MTLKQSHPIYALDPVWHLPAHRHAVGTFPICCCGCGCCSLVAKSAAPTSLSGPRLLRSALQIARAAGTRALRGAGDAHHAWLSCQGAAQTTRLPAADPSHDALQACQACPDALEQCYPADQSAPCKNLQTLRRSSLSWHMRFLRTPHVSTKCAHDAHALHDVCKARLVCRYVPGSCSQAVKCAARTFFSSFQLKEQRRHAWLEYAHTRCQSFPSRSHAAC
mmetsp:Transcript_95528/g.179776  ORF Transcript_95528/g.179776 Transcript_95528/m.179776 type:complete len:221 (-) Transcript_95528:249-911(-)